MFRRSFDGYLSSLWGTGHDLSALETPSVYVVILVNTFLRWRVWSYQHRVPFEHFIVHFVSDYHFGSWVVSSILQHLNVNDRTLQPGKPSSLRIQHRRRRTDNLKIFSTRPGGRHRSHCKSECSRKHTCVGVYSQHYRFPLHDCSAIQNRRLRRQSCHMLLLSDVFGTAPSSLWLWFIGNYCC